jgi:hypothetical protein
MKKLLLIIGFAIFFVSCTKEELDNLLNNTSSTLTNEEVIQGLRAALTVGTDTSVTILNKLDGYYGDEVVKILLPQEAQVIYQRVSSIPGLSNLLDQTILSMNRAAEDAATEAKPIFVNAITGITIADGFAILNGSDTAATAYLNSRTYTPLFDVFKPKIETSLGKPLVAGLSTEQIYKNLIDAYNVASLNGLLFERITNNTLSAHVTGKALDGLFIKVADQEMKIRKDPLARVTEILQRVFGSKG